MDFIWLKIRQHLSACVPLPLSITWPPCLPVHLLYVNLCWDLKLILSLNEMLWGLNCEYKSRSDCFCLSYICKSKIFIEDCLKEIKHNSCFYTSFTYSAEMRRIKESVQEKAECWQKKLFCLFISTNLLPLLWELFYLSWFILISSAVRWTLPNVL